MVLRNASAATTQLTKFQFTAMAASINSSVMSISAARLREMVGVSVTAGVEQNRPRFTPDTANFFIFCDAAKRLIKRLQQCS